MNMWNGGASSDRTPDCKMKSIAYNIIAPIKSFCKTFFAVLKCFLMGISWNARASLYKYLRAVDF